ncbi:MAG: hypothetical protein ABMA13_05045 [Chthoniobacteraceae bacterium]
MSSALVPLAVFAGSLVSAGAYLSALLVAGFPGAALVMFWHRARNWREEAEK